MPKGGKRPGAGLPKGYKFKHTIEKELERERLRQLVVAEMEPMTRAQIEHAKGVSYMVLRHKDGTFTRATDQKQLDAAIAAGAESFRIFTQAPNVQAYADLMNRALDKPKEQALDVNVKGELRGKSDAEILAALAAIQRKLKRDAD